MSVDNRIVEMRFNNQQFEENVQKSIISLEKLKGGLNLDGAAKSLQTLEAEGKRFSLQNISDSLEMLTGRFSTMGIVGMTVIQDITQMALNKGKQLLDMSLGQIKRGGAARAKNLEQAKFQFANLGVDAEKALDSANRSVLGTMFGFDAAAKAGSQLAATGIDVGDSLFKALRGTAGLATMTGSSFEDISHIMTTIAGNGRLMGDQLRRFGMRGLNIAAILGTELGKSESEIREMVRKGQIDFELFSEVMYEKFGEAATEASGLYSGAVAHARAALSRIGGTFAPVLFDNMRDFLLELRRTIDRFHNVLKPFLPQFEVFVKAIQEFATSTIKGMEFNFFTNIINGLIAFGDVVWNIIKPISKAFTEIFPPLGMNRLMSATAAFKDFGESVANVVKKAADPLTRTFKGLFAVIDIGVTFAIALASAIWDLAGAFLPLGNNLLDMTAGFGDFLVGIRDSIKESDIFGKVFKGMVDVLKPIISAVVDLLQAVLDKVGLFKSVDTKPIDEFGQAVDKGFKPLKLLGDAIKGLGRAIEWVLRGVTPMFVGLADMVSKGLQAIKDAIKSALRSEEMTKGLDVINTGLFGLLIITINKFVKKVKDFKIEFAGVTDLIKSIKDIFGSLGSVLGDFQKSIQAKTLKGIAISLGILAGAILVLSLIDPVRLAASLGAMGVLMTELFGSMGIFEKVMGGSGFKNMGRVTTNMIKLSIALLILSSALKKISKIDQEGLTRGLFGIGVMMAELILAMKFMPDTKKLTGKATGLILLSTALVILSSAVKKLSQIPFGDLMKGLLGVGVLLTELILAMKFMPDEKKMISKSTGLLILSGALITLVGVVRKLGSMEADILKQGLLGIGGILVALAAFVNLTGGAKKVISTATGLTILSVALNLMVGAIRKLGNMEWDNLKQGLLGMGAIMTGLVITLNLMKGTLGGAAAMVLASIAINLLVPALLLLSKIEPKGMAIGIGLLAAALGVLGGAAYLLAPLLPVILGISAAFLAIGLAMTALATGGLIASIAASFSALALTIMNIGIIEVIEGMMRLIPAFVKSIVGGFVEIIKSIDEAAPIIFETITTVLLHLLDTIIDITPKLAETIMIVGSAALEVMRELIPDIIETGIVLILALLDGLNEHVEDIVDIAVDLIINFVDALAKQIPKLLGAGADLIIEFISGLATTLRTKRKPLIAAIQDLIRELINTAIDALFGSLELFIDVGKDLIGGLISGMLSLVGKLWDAAKELAGKAVNAVKNVFKSSSPSKVAIGLGQDFGGGLAIGIDRSGSVVIDTIDELGEDATDAMSQVIKGIYEALDGDPDLTPTITPVLDLSMIEASKHTINSLFGKRSINLSGQAGGALNAEVKSVENNQNGSKPQEISLVQNNYSPKSLSRIEIYRQTKNQISMLKGVLANP